MEPDARRATVVAEFPTAPDGLDAVTFENAGHFGLLENAFSLTLELGTLVIPRVSICV